MQIEVLKMGWCKVGENEGAKAIADLILFNTSIATLDLRGNSLNNPGGPLLHILQQTSADPLVLSLTTQATILQRCTPIRKCLLLPPVLHLPSLASTLHFFQKIYRKYRKSKF